MGALEFVWDETKNERNIAKHGISFEQASSVFHDPYQIVLENYFFTDEGEQREMIIGVSRGVLLIAVVFVERGHLIRIINARRAEKYEQKIYTDNLPKGEGKC